MNFRYVGTFFSRISNKMKFFITFLEKLQKLQNFLQLYLSEFKYFLALETASESWDIVFLKNSNNLSAYFEITMYAYSIDHIMRYISEKFKKLQNEFSNFSINFFENFRKFLKNSGYKRHNWIKTGSSMPKGRKVPFAPILGKKNILKPSVNKI